MNLPIQIREAVKADLALIYSSWLKSYRESQPAKKVRRTVYFKGQHTLIEKTLGSGATTLIACSNTDPDLVYGWVCFAKDGERIFHYAYVKQAFRQMGILKAMLAAVDDGGPFYYSHDLGLDSKIGTRAIYNPYATLL